MALVAWNGQDEFGGHSFTQDTGEELYVPDSPDARRIAFQLTSQPDERTAGGLRLSRGDSPFSGQSPPPAPPPVATDVPAPIYQQGPRGPVVAQPYKPGAPPAAPPPAPELPTLPVSGAAQPTDKPLLSEREEALGTAPMRGGGGISQKDLLEKAKHGVPIPQSQAVETTGAIPENPSIEQAWVDAKKAEYEAQKKIAESNLAEAEANRLQALDQKIKHQNEVSTSLAHLEAVRTEADNKMKIIRDFDTDAQKRYADFGPERFFKSPGTWATIGAAIAQGAGAYAAIVGHTENYAMQIINQAVERDVMAQRDEYMRDRDARNNLVADLARATGDIDAATEGAKAIQLGMAKAHGDEVAALSKRKDVENNWQIYQAQFQAGIVDHMQKAYERGLGNTVIKTAGQYKYPQAGGAPTELQQLEYTGKVESVKTGIAKQRQERRDLSGGGPRETEIAPGVHARDRVEAKDIRVKLSDIDATDKMLEDLQRQTEKHPVAAQVGGARYPLTSKAISSAGASIASKKNVAVGGLGRLSGSGVVNPGEYPRLVKALDTPDGIQGVRDELAIQKRALLEGHSKTPLAPAPKPLEESK